MFIKINNLKVISLIKVLGLLILFNCHFAFSQAYQTINLKEEGGVYKIPCKVNGLNMNFISDTGAADVSISKSEFQFMVKHGYIQDRDLRGVTTYQIANGSTVIGRQFNIREIQVGSSIFYDVNATVIDRENVPLLFGQSIIKRFGKYSIDTKKQQLFIAGQKPNIKFINNFEKNIHSFMGVPFSSPIDDFRIALESNNFVKDYEFIDEKSGDYCERYSGNLISIKPCTLEIYSSPESHLVWGVYIWFDFEENSQSIKPSDVLEVYEEIESLINVKYLESADKIESYEIINENLRPVSFWLDEYKVDEWNEILLKNEIGSNEFWAFLSENRYFNWMNISNYANNNYKICDNLFNVKLKVTDQRISFSLLLSEFGKIRYKDFLELLKMEREEWAQNHF